jgi:transposase
MALVRWVGRAIGLDVHRDFCVVAICEDGKVRSAGRVPSTLEGLGVLAESLLPTDRVALEVKASCWEVARILEPHVQRVVVVSPDDTGIASARAKTDKLDARALALLLWKGELDPVWMPDERCRVLRRRLNRREQLLHARSHSKNEISAVLQRQARSGRISKRGSASARWALVEAAWSVVKQPGPLRAFYERVRARRGHGKAIVATARKLAILFWCMLSRGEDYAHQCPALTKKKLRELELTAGAKPRTKAAAGIWSTNRTIRDAERALTLQAEISYQRMVTDQQAGAPARKVGASATPERA